MKNKHLQIQIATVLAFITLCASCRKPLEQDAPSNPIDVDRAVSLFGTPLSHLGKQTDPNKVLLTVNGTPILQSMLSVEIQPLVRKIRTDLPPEQRMEQLQQARQIALSSIIQKELLREAAIEKGLAISDVELEKAHKDFLRKLPEGTELTPFLAKNGVTSSQFDEMLTAELLRAKLLEHLTSDLPPPSEEDAQQFYRSQTNLFTVPETAEIERIHFPLTPDAPASVSIKAKQSAELSYEKLVSGGIDFESFASENEGFNYAKERINTKNVNPNTKNIIFSLSPGELTEPFILEDGYYIVRLLEKNPARTLSFDESKEQILQLLEQQKKQEVIQTFIKALQEQATIEQPKQP